MSIQFNKTMRLSGDQYIAESHPKSMIVLHHTVGGTAKSTFEWWQKGDLKRIATAFIVERDGTVYEVFDHKYWAYHLGLNGIFGVNDKRSIGIEIASEGGLIKSSDGKLYCFDRVNPRTEFKDEYYDYGRLWRGYRYYAAYTPPQLDSVIALINCLCNIYGIKRQTPKAHYSYSSDLYEYEGVIGHHHVRGDKSDIHPGFDWNRLIEEVNLSLT